MAATKTLRIPLDDKDRDRLATLLDAVPTETVTRFVWSSDEGRRFIKELRRLQLKGVPANWMAEALNITASSVNGALGYWERTNSRNPRSTGNRRRRQQRPLNPSTEEESA